MSESHPSGRSANHCLAPTSPLRLQANRFEHERLGTSNPRARPRPSKFIFRQHSGQTTTLAWRGAAGASIRTSARRWVAGHGQGAARQRRGLPTRTWTRHDSDAALGGVSEARSAIQFRVCMLQCVAHTINHTPAPSCTPPRRIAS
jgi:hypothetical protein